MITARILRTLAAAAALAAAGLMTGCAGMQGRDSGDYQATLPPQQPVQHANNGAIYQADTAIPLFEDTRAHRVGDILTIVLTESTDASKSTSTTTSKATKLDTGTPTIFGTGVKLGGKNVLNASVDSSSDFSGSGDTAQSNSLSGTISVTVAHVYPNGNMLVRGEKRLVLNRGEEYVKVSGIVRPVDVAADNTVASTQLADAHIAYSGKGAVSDASAMGWLARFFIGKFWPF
ncbi:MAG: flagellar basal body L-ring protein FlgH [Gammaproteobacteria bacterium]